MTTPPIRGLWLPLVTPFRDGELDDPSLRRLTRHMAGQPINGLVLAATSGEGLALDEDETEALVGCVAGELAAAGRRLPIMLGLSGVDTRKMVAALDRTAGWPIAAYLVACPYYVRPAQAGLVAHFTALANAAAHPLLIYNIPYRTGVNLLNPAMLALAVHPNIAGVKDCCADAAQAFDLLATRPPGFAILTGEDALYGSALLQGADGGITLSAHIRTAEFARIRDLAAAGDGPAALTAWRDLAHLPRLLFSEPSPAPVKHWLWRQGLIGSPEVRLPMTRISDSLAARIDAEVAG